MGIAFNPNSVTLGNTTSLQFTITNPNVTPLTGVGFNDTLPTGLSVPNASATVCGGTVTLTSPTSISMTSATVSGSTQCIFSVTVTGNVVGSYTNTTSAVTSNEGGSGNTASAGLTVTGSPTVTVAFLPNSIAYGNTTSLQFDILNPASNAASMTGISFNDTLPTNLTVPNASATVCGGTVTLTSPHGVSMSNASLTAGTHCIFSVTVTGVIAGNYSLPTTVTSTNGGTSNTATAGLTVTGTPPSIATAFLPASIAYGNTTSLQFTIGNTNAAALTGVGFTDTLPNNLSVPNASATVCGGTVTLTSPHGISMTGATVSANSQCLFSVTVTGSVKGNYTNTTSVVTSTEAGNGSTSSAGLTVTGTAPTITKSFLPNSIALGSTTSLQFTIANANTSSLTGVGFTDTLPTGLTVPNASATVCGGTVTLTSPTGISMTGATVTASSNCIFSVTVTGAVVGNYTNTTSAVTSTEAGNGSAASAGLAVTGTAPTLATSFGPAAIPQSATTALTFTITNPAGNAVALTGVGFTDTLPTGLTVPNASAAVCGGTVTLTSPTGISLSGATVNANGNCIFAVTVTGAVNGSYTNTTSAVVSTNGGTGNTSSANLLVGPGTITLLASCANGGNWSNAACWNLGRAPITGDDVVIGGSGQANTNYDLGAGVQLHSVTVQNSSASTTVTGGPISLQSGGSITDSNGVGTDVLPNWSFGGPTTVSVTLSAGTLRLGSIAATGGLTKLGPGTLLLPGTNTFTGVTQVNGGTLNVSGSLGAVTVNSGGTLTGTGTVASISALSGGVVSGNLNVTGGVTFAAGSSFNAVLSSNSTFSQLIVGGTVDLTAGPTLNVTTAPGFTPAPGSTFLIVPGTVTGTFSGLPNGGLINTGGVVVRVNYGSVILTVTSIPSIPALSWWGLTLLGVLLAAFAYSLGRPRTNSAYTK
jgi:uncharacterized repeat protein (TIGR01451 family)